jgi:hypothetical protein
MTHVDWFLDQLGKANRCQVNLQRKEDRQSRGEELQGKVSDKRL